MPYDLDRFVVAQTPLHAQARRELADGRKRTHWMWFVFPQLNGLGHSAMAKRYAIVSLEEAEAYLNHPLLGPRLIDDVELVNRLEGRSMNGIFGSPDDMKFHSSMTLFASVPGTPAVFAAALVKYFGGARDPRTSHILEAKDQA